MNLLRSLASISSMTLLSRILGFVREFVVARAFGATMATDAFFVAFRLPNLLRRMFAEGAFSQAFVPILAEYKNKQGELETKRLVDHVATLLFLVVTGITVLGIIITPAIIYVSAPGFSKDADKFALTVTMTRITFPYILFMSLTALAGGILNTWSRFMVPAFTPVLLNVSFIAMALFAAPYFDPPVLALAWAVFLGGVIQLGLQFPFLKQIKMLPRFSFTLKDPGVNRILKLMAPALVGVSASQISLIINTIYASFLVSGSVSWLNYADRLMEFPAGMLGVALGTVLLPSLAKFHADAKPEEFSALLDWGLRLTLMLTLPAALALALLSIPLISTLFVHGAYTAADAMQTRSALLAYSAGLIGLIMVKVLAPGFYSRQDFRTPVRIALYSLVGMQIMNLAFIFPLKHAGLALATGLASCANAGMLLRGLLQKGVYRPKPGWPLFTLKLLGALAVLSAVLWFGAGPDQAWFHYSGLERVLRLTALVLGGIGTYFIALYGLGFRLRDFRRRGAD